VGYSVTPLPYTFEMGGTAKRCPDSEEEQQLLGSPFPSLLKKSVLGFFSHEKGTWIARIRHREDPKGFCLGREKEVWQQRGEMGAKPAGQQLGWDPQAPAHCAGTGRTAATKLGRQMEL